MFVNPESNSTSRSGGARLVCPICQWLENWGSQAQGPPFLQSLWGGGKGEGLLFSSPAQIEMAIVGGKGKGWEKTQTIRGCAGGPLEATRLEGSCVETPAVSHHCRTENMQKTLPH